MLRQKIGKQIEKNVIKSFLMANVPLKKSVELDHNHKIDFILFFENQKCGIQFSLRKDSIKAKIAKTCALDVVSRFIYLTLSKNFFDKPDKKNGMDLYRLLGIVFQSYPQKALWVNIDMKGMNVKAI